MGSSAKLDSILVQMSVNVVLEVCGVQCKASARSEKGCWRMGKTCWRLREKAENVR